MQYDFDTRVDRKNRGTIKELLFTPENSGKKGLSAIPGRNLSSRPPGR